MPGWNNEAVLDGEAVHVFQNPGSAGNSPHEFHLVTTQRGEQHQSSLPLQIVSIFEMIEKMSQKGVAKTHPRASAIGE